MVDLVIIWVFKGTNTLIHDDGPKSHGMEFRWEHDGEPTYWAHNGKLTRVDPKREFPDAYRWALAIHDHMTKVAEAYTEPAFITAMRA